MDKRDSVILRKVLSEISVAQEMLGGCTLSEFLDNEMLKRAVRMTVINIGELVKNLSEDCRRDHTEILWKEIAGFRDIAAHKYQTLKMEDVYVTASVDFPTLYTQIKRGQSISPRISALVLISLKISCERITQANLPNATKHPYFSSRELHATVSVYSPHESHPTASRPVLRSAYHGC